MIISFIVSANSKNLTSMEEMDEKYHESIKNW